jgi:shikimate kinase / 3-dehydroquinate synthase
MATTITIPRPNRVLSPVRFYVNRDDEINTLVSILYGNHENPAAGKKCILGGKPGFGKTELCLKAAYRLRLDFSDAQIYIKLQENDSPELSILTALETIIHIFDPYAQISDDLLALHEQCSTILEGKKVLVILDDLQFDNYLDLLDLPSSCGLLITTNKDLETSNRPSVNLGGLSQKHSEKLLLEICYRIGKHAAHLANICQAIPLNLCLVAGYLNCTPTINVDDFIIDLEKHLQLSKEPEISINEKILNYIFEQLTETERNLFAQLSIFSNGFNIELIQETILSGLNDDTGFETIQEYLDTFTQLNLLTYDEVNNYYNIQSTVQNYAAQKLGDAHEIWRRLGEAFADFGKFYYSFANKNADGFLLSLLMLDEYKATIKSILQHLLKDSSIERDQILLVFHEFVRSFERSRFALKIELVPLLEAMLEASYRLQNHEKLVEILGDLSNAHQTLEDVEKAGYYSKLQEEVTRDGQSECARNFFESIAKHNAESSQISNVNSDNTDDLISSVLDELSANKTKIVLTGFMGTGKTTVGKLLAENLNYRFIDTDELIEGRHERSIANIFQDLGEDAFREMERAIVKEIAELDSVVISTGGRLMLDPENVSALSRNSRVLCLVATPNEILTRVTHDTSHERPLLSVPNPKERIVELLQERNDKYLRFPQIVTDEKKPNDIARSLVEFVSTSPKSLVVENPHKNYEYIVGAGLLPFIRQLTGIEGEIVIITDEIVKEYYGPSCSSVGHIVEIPPGRKNKTLEIVKSVYEQLLDMSLDRSGTIISLGGSVVGDVAGYVAATYMRGVNFVQCPTSLIAMVDTSVGGKTGIDLPQGKNIIGLYKQPMKVIADVATLQTLPQKDFTSGMAEVIKHGLIAESSLLEQVEQGQWAKNWDRSPSYIGELQRLVAQAIQVKINIVQADPFEQGKRSILNLGHTFAYAIEQRSKNAYRHGEAVSIGLVAAANLSARMGLCDYSLQERIESILESVNLPTRIPSSLKPMDLLQAMQRDKKKRAGQLRFILIRGIGQVFVSDKVSDQDVLDTISSLSK